MHHNTHHTYLLISLTIMWLCRNSEIRCRWQRLCIRHRDPTIVPHAISFVKEVRPPVTSEYGEYGEHSAVSTVRIAGVVGAASMGEQWQLRASHRWCAVDYCMITI